MTVSTTPPLLDGVEQFMRAADQPIPNRPWPAEPQVMAARLLMLAEEVDELMQALGLTIGDLSALHNQAQRDHDAAVDVLTEQLILRRLSGGHGTVLVGTVDAWLDIVVIAYGGCLESAGIDGTHRAAAEVTRSNLAKIVDGQVVKRSDGKVLKPCGWTPPNIPAALSL